MANLGASPTAGMNIPDRGNVASSMQLGYTEYEFLDASAGNATAATVTNCRAIKADIGGFVKIDYTKADGSTVTEVLTLVSGIPLPVRNVVTLYRYYVGTIAGTATSYSSAGAEITNAIKLLR